MRNQIYRATAAALLLVFTAATVHADEGMWTFDNPPTKLIQQKYGFTVTKQWLDHVRLSCVRLNDGGSGSFVSADGLLLTNHHVARGQLQKSSTAEHDYVHNGFYAATSDQEIKSPDLEVNVLQSTEDVTARVEAAVKGGMSDDDAFKARNAVIAAIEAESTKATGLRSDVVTLYQGGEYWLPTAIRNTPMSASSSLPRTRPPFLAATPTTLPIRATTSIWRSSVSTGERQTESTPTTISPGAPTGAPKERVGLRRRSHPGSTQRQDTVAQLTFERDTIEPTVITLLEDRINVLQQYSALGAEQARQAASQIFGLQNGLKAYRGRKDGLDDKKVFDKKVHEETEFRDKVMANPTWAKDYGDAWKEIEDAIQQQAADFPVQFYHRSGSATLATALQLVQYVAEIAKPDGERLPGVSRGPAGIAQVPATLACALLPQL